jgi:hypothetical protein
VVVVDCGVPEVTRGSGNSGGERDGHEAETFPLQVLHGGAHVLLHELGHQVLGDGEAVVRQHRLVAVRDASNGPAINPSLNTITTTTIQRQERKKERKKKEKRKTLSAGQEYPIQNISRSYT